jgi:D-aminopeptidase
MSKTRTWCPTPFAAIALLAALQMAPQGQARPRARELGVPFDGTPGPLNAITDVAGVTVGHATIISGDGPLVVGKGPVRTGVTAVLPRGRDTLQKPSFAGWFSLNGNGEMTGTTWVEESGFLEGPVLITNTHSVGVVRDAAIAWRLKAGPPDASGFWWALPVVAETWDGYLNDINGMHVKPEHVFRALDEARGGRVPEGSVGGGTGMVCYGFKGGIGTASRRIGQKDGGYTVGVLLQANFGLRRQLRVAGVPVGTEITEGDSRDGSGAGEAETGSVIVVVATDAPLLPHQLKRLARRVSLGLARTGAMSGNSSGDIFIAFSTANPGAFTASGQATLTMVSNEDISPLFDATTLATEEAVINALVAADTMTGADNHRVIGLPHDRLREVLRKYNRLVNPAS